MFARAPSPTTSCPHRITPPPPQHLTAPPSLIRRERLVRICHPKSKYCKMYGSRCSIVDGIKRGPNMTISGKTALVCGYNDDASKGCAMALKQGGANVVVAEADPNLATQARLRGFLVMNKALDNVVSEADILVANFNMDNIDVLSNVKNMKNNAVICNTSSIRTHFPLQAVIVHLHLRFHNLKI